MNIVVTGSIAFDYLMSFPGKFTEHFLPEHMKRVSLSFLVDTMDKRRGGCAPNIAYTLALLGERPRLMATAGQDFGDYRHWLEAAGVDTSLVEQVAGKFTRLVLLQHRRRQQPDRVVLHRRDGQRRRAVVPHRRATAGWRSSRRTIPARWCSTPRSAARSASRSSSIRASSARGCPATSCATASIGAAIVICNDYEFELIRQKTGLDEDGDPRADAARWSSRAASTAARSSTRRRPRRRARGDAASDRRSDRRRRRVPRRVHEGPGARRELSTTCARLGSVAATYALEHLGGQSHAYTWEEFRARYEEHFGEAPPLT